MKEMMCCKSEENKYRKIKQGPKMLNFGASKSGVKGDQAPGPPRSTTEHDTVSTRSEHCSPRVASSIPVGGNFLLNLFCSNKFLRELPQ